MSAKSRKRSRSSPKRRFIKPSQPLEGPRKAPFAESHSALRDEPRSGREKFRAIRKRFAINPETRPWVFRTLAGCEKEMPIQCTREGSSASGHFGLIRKQSEMSCRKTGKNFWQAEMSRVFWLPSFGTFRDDCPICFVPFLNLRVQWFSCKLGFF
jgi:hypothetical protein